MIMILLGVLKKICYCAGSDDEISEVSSEVSNEADVEYTEVVHARAADPGRGERNKHTEKRQLIRTR